MPQSSMSHQFWIKGALTLWASSTLSVFATVAVAADMLVPRILVAVATSGLTTYLFWFYGWFYGGFDGRLDSEVALIIVSVITPAANSPSLTHQFHVQCGGRSQGFGPAAGLDHWPRSTRGLRASSTLGW